MQSLQRFTLLVDPSKHGWRDLTHSAYRAPHLQLTDHLLLDLYSLEANGVLVGVKVEGDSKRGWVYRRRKAGVQENMTLGGEREGMGNVALRKEDITCAYSC